VGEFTYRYGMLSWFTQGLPYYIFAFLFAIFFAKKVRAASLFTIPEKITSVYGKNAGILASLIVFVLVSPAPYLLMIGSLISLIFHISMLPSLILAFILSSLYLLKGGYKGGVFVDAFQFFVMFAAFIMIVAFSFSGFGGFDYLSKNLPSNHLTITGGASPLYILVWFLIALWTFADPGFHQRCYAAKTPGIAKKGILISIFFWAFFDFLTTSTGLFARANLPNLSIPSLSYPLYAEKILSSGFKGLFFAGLVATILSTLNSFLFLSGTTITRDFIYKFFSDKKEQNVRGYTILGICLAGAVSILISYYIQSVIEMWYLIGSVCIPGMIFAIMSAYYPKYKIKNKVMFFEMLLAVTSSISWYICKQHINPLSIIYEIEPMIVGLFVGAVIHIVALIKERNLQERATIEITET
ncbi:MAG: hypothetical protein Q8903_02645, partial [Bacteroidota bacterium]|nr:hypothetical protein [Bacteroidota bacterium]